jgi:hypothetical protein
MTDHIGTVNIEADYTITDYQEEPMDVVILEIFIEDKATVDLLREQGDLTHLVTEYPCFQSRTKYIDNSDDERNTLSIELTCGTLSIDSTFMQLECTVRRSPGKDPGFFVAYRLVNLEG